MDLQELFWVMAPAFGIYAGFVLVSVKYKQKKEKEAIKNKEEKRIKQAELGFFNYLYFVYFIRSKLRPASTFLFLFFGFLPGLIFLAMNIRDYYEPVLKLEQMQTDVGIVQKINLAYRGSDTLKLLRDDGSIVKYYLGSSKKSKKLLEGKKVKIYYQNVFALFYFKDDVKAIELDKEIVKTHNGLNYQNWGYPYRLQTQQEAPADIIFWAIYNFIFLLWMFYFNYKEKPIHRLNRIRKLHNKQMVM